MVNQYIDLNWKIIDLVILRSVHKTVINLFCSNLVLICAWIYWNITKMIKIRWYPNRQKLVHLEYSEKSLEIQIFFDYVNLLKVVPQKIGIWIYFLFCFLLNFDHLQDVKILLYNWLYQLPFLHNSDLQARICLGVWG